MAHNVEDINHAQFANDTLLLGGASVITARNFKRELDIYKEVSGSKINYQKSMIYWWNCPNNEMIEITRILYMEGTVSWESFKYLGIPIFRKNSKASHWNPILEKMKSIIQAWGAS